MKARSLLRGLKFDSRTATPTVLQMDTVTEVQMGQLRLG